MFAFQPHLTIPVVADLLFSTMIINCDVWPTKTFKTLSRHNTTNIQVKSHIVKKVIV